MASQVSLNTLDPRATAGLKQLAEKGENSDEVLRAASKQVEAMFLQMMLKAMRDASPANGPFDSEQTKFAQQLYDQQLASDLAQSKGVGLADALFRQLGGGRQPVDLLQVPGVPQVSGVLQTSGALQTSDMPQIPNVLQSTEKINQTIEAARKPSGQVPEHVRNFVADVWPHAHEASRVTGIPAHFMVAQAALETGWGTKQIKNADGTPSYNLFNIKAGSSWKGATTAQQTVVEFEEGSKKNTKASFRAYSSYAEAFADYARLLTDSPRYAKVLGKRDASSFAQGLQQAGYATDPQYADKLVRIISSNTLKNALGA